MPMDGLTLGYIARALRAELTGARIDKAQQPERDELILTLRNHGKNLMLLLSANAGMARMHLIEEKKSNPLEPPMFCMLMRKHIVGGRIADVRQMGGDRVIEIDIENLSELGDQQTLTLVCEFMGKHSNIMLINQNARIIDAIRHVTGDISRVREVLPGLTYERPPEQDKLRYDGLDFPSVESALADASGSFAKWMGGAVTGLSRQTASEIALELTGDEATCIDALDKKKLAQNLTDWFSNLPAPNGQLVKDEAGMPVDLTAFAYARYRYLNNCPMPSLSEGMDAFYRERDRVDRVHQKSAALRRVLKNNIERCEKKLALQYEALTGSERMEEYRVKGELLSAQLDQIKKGQKTVMLTNYYDENCAPIAVALDEKLSPAKNAERYFKKYQKARSAQKLAHDQKEKTEEELRYFENQLYNLENCADEAGLSEIREELQSLGFVRANHNRRQIKKLAPSKPIHYVSSTGIDILVGRNNLQNELLTKTAEPNEIWLHAKDMPGSHVIIVGDDPDEQTLFEAAVLAAKHSKGSAGSRVSVDYTFKRHVKKPSGSKPGYVIYTNQKTLYVAPNDPVLEGVREAEG